MLKQSIQITIGLITFIVVFISTTYFSVYLFVKNEKKIIIPDVSGKDIIYVLELLSENQLNTKVEGTEYHSTIPKNHVIYQYPKPGTEVKNGRDVSIVLSKGSKWLMLPDLSGVSTEKAQILLDKNRLCRGMITQIYHTDFDNDIIVSHYPEAGSKVTRNTCINLLISRGNRNKKYQMPDFTGISLEETLMVLSKINIQPLSVQYTSDNQWPENRILKQKPVYGYAITKDEPVYLTVNRKKQIKFNNKSGVSLFVFTVPNGFLQKYILVRLNIFGVTIHVYDDFLRPAHKVHIVIPNGCDASVFVYQDDELVESKFY
jgi:serine/threonine-protein kinase